VPQREFARRIGVAQSTVMRIENLDQNVTLETLEQLCRAFRVDIGDLFPVAPERPARSPYPMDDTAARAGYIHEPERGGRRKAAAGKRGKATKKT